MAEAATEIGNESDNMKTLMSELLGKLLEDKSFKTKLDGYLERLNEEKVLGCCGDVRLNFYLKLDEAKLLPPNYEIGRKIDLSVMDLKFTAPVCCNLDDEEVHIGTLKLATVEAYGQGPDGVGWVPHQSSRYGVVFDNASREKVLKKICPVYSYSI